MKKSIILFLVLGMCFLTGCSSQNEGITAKEYASTSDGDVEETQVIVEQSTQQAMLIYVYVCGHVEQPGVYPLEIGSRVCDALELAGGVTLDGKPEALNQAEYIEDGQTIYVPGLDEETKSAEVEDGLVDINEADQSMLMTLPGIGESKANLIIQYREEHGDFETIEELKDIPGIKEGIFNKIKDSIKVS